ncbi:18103_t:CDS:2, partial [Racocetra fulgida]
SAEIDQGKRTATGNTEVIIGSVQTLGKTGSSRIEKYDPSHFKAIIIDEVIAFVVFLNYFNFSYGFSMLHLQQAHHAAASTYLRRYDGLALDGIFDEITYHKDFLEMIKEKWYTTYIMTGTDLSRVKSNTIDFIPTILSKLVNVKNRNEIIVRTYLKLAVDIDHVESLTKMFQEHGINAYSILTEGMDVPTIDCVIMSRPTKSHVLFQQMIGRGMRIAEDKEDCLVLDFIDSYYKIPELVTAPTLFGLDPTVELNDYTPSIKENKGLESKEKIKMEQQLLSDVADITKIKITEYSNPFEIIEDCSGATSVGAISEFAWLRVSHDIYVLSLYEIGTLRVEKDNQ